LVNLFSSLEELERGHGFNACLLRRFAIFIDVDLHELDTGELSCHLFELRSNHRARRAPGGEEVDDEQAVGGGSHGLVEGVQSRKLVERAAAQAQHQVERGLLLDVVVLQRAPVFELLAREDEALLVGRDAFLVLDLGLDVLNGVALLDVQGNCLAGEGFDEDLHGVIVLLKRITILF